MRIYSDGKGYQAPHRAWFIHPNISTRTTADPPNHLPTTTFDTPFDAQVLRVWGSREAMVGMDSEVDNWELGGRVSWEMRERNP